jgi:SAM-dependent methyltransferase
MSDLKITPASNTPAKNVIYLSDPARTLIYPDPVDGSAGLPVPPPECMQYGETPERHLAGGKVDADRVKSVLLQGGFDIDTCTRFLDWGCSNGRVLRHFADWAQRSEAWGVDINARTAMWAATHLRPSFRCLAATSAPHLPFADGTFGMIYGLSILTHIDDLFPAWLAELGRVAQPGGYVLLTIHDEATIEILKTGYAKQLGDMLFQNEAYEAYEQAKIGMLSLRVGTGCQVFFKRKFFCDFLSDHFEIVSATTEVMAKLQTGILARRK